MALASPWPDGAAGMTTPSSAAAGVHFESNTVHFESNII
jgi:hypothetical protein